MMSNTTSELSYSGSGLASGNRHFIMQEYFRSPSTISGAPETFVRCNETSHRQTFVTVGSDEVRSSNLLPINSGLRVVWTSPYRVESVRRPEVAAELIVNAGDPKCDYVVTLRTNESTTINSSDVWLSEVLAKVGALARLPADWDGEGGPKISPIAIVAAVRVIAELPQSFPKPHVAPVIGGGVQLEWETNDKGLELEVLSSGEMLYLRSEGDNYQEGAVTGQSALHEHLTWIAGF